MYCPTLAKACLLVLFAATPALAGRHPISDAADNYREAVKDFERAVFRSNEMGRDQRRLADALEDQTSRVRNEARDLDHLTRLGIEIDTAARLHQQIEQFILGNPSCPSRGVLLPAWQHVQYSFQVLGDQFESLQYPVYNQPIQPSISPWQSGYRGLPTYPARRVVVPSPIIRTTPIVPPVINPAAINPFCPQSAFRAASPYRRAPVGNFGVGAYLQR